jgi:uncharacterized protein (TIGR00252 family)
MKTTEQGQQAEAAVAGLLGQDGFELLDKNWKTKVCEIDLVMQKHNVIFFVEVKYRGSQFQGGGFDYITDQKLRKMTFAAEVWKRQYDWAGDYRLMAAAVSGPDCRDIQLIELD